MADDEERPGQPAELVHQPPLGREIQVVGGLVEDHRLRPLEQHPHEVDPPALTPRQRGHVLEEEVLGQPEPISQSGDVPLHLVTAQGPVALLQDAVGANAILRRRCGHGRLCLVELIVENVEPPGR